MAMFGATPTPLITKSQKMKQLNNFKNGHKQHLNLLFSIAHVVIGQKRNQHLTKESITKKN